MTNSNVVKSVVPSITSAIYRAKETQSYMQPQTCAIAALAIFHMMTSFTRDDVVPAMAMVSLAEASIKKANSTNNDLKQFHYVDPSINLIGLAKHLGYISIAEDKSFTMTERWIELVSTKETCTPLTEAVSELNRRKPFIKGGKRKPSKLMSECIDFLQSTEYHVDAPMVDIVGDVLNMTHGDIPAVIQQELHVWNNARNMVREDVLFSDYFADNRGRLYHVACAGPNPQSSDFARSLYSHNIENIVKKDSAAYQMFMAELYDISGGKWTEARMLTRVAQNPAGALAHMLRSGDAPKKPFTYIRLALDWFKFETTGECDSRVGFGLDAKCSGTQYLAFIAGNMQMAQATGLVDSESKASDPYQLSLVELMKLLEKSSMNPSDEIKAQYFNPKDGRNFIKTPYMAVQYGGGKKALTGNKDFATTVATIFGADKVDAFAELAVEAVKAALGEKINMFIAKVMEAVAKKCEAESKLYIDYRHTDGQVVHKPCYPSREICDAFSIRVDSTTRVIFGQQNEGKPWMIRETQPTAEEFVRTFVVNYIQGIDALVARTVAKYAKKAGLRGFTSIHDCFRCCLADAPLMMDVIRQAYVEIFVKNNQFEALAKQIGGIDMFHTNIVTEELLMSEHAYYFCQ
ncbi:RNA polymerase [Erwinia phage Fougasse]|nr:RNA polymerase [Erwinia phage Berlingot]WJN63873.1 RNA polymerase [Erwinia phage Calisson]WJN63964.1 RNA polymerase [Erwinia phage Fougasse]WJN64096.1 RNA polymerase [Erwinia phage Mauresque]WJN64173.1 RNA polymerase [Erwinia phage Navette]WJN64197.1 RNA polymerase [Erwinia phage Nougat]WJN64328.1 RNA polymerase [Erwinia phage Orgeat]WJN64537.1 RNA polymerase [Erwinia phage Papaline]